jgi:peroxin-5
MALRDLVEGDCGGTNSLVRLTSHFVQDRGLKEEGLRHPFPNGDGFSNTDSDQVINIIDLLIKEQILRNIMGFHTC